MKFHGEISDLEKKLASITGLEFSEPDNNLYLARLNNQDVIRWNRTTGTLDCINEPACASEIRTIFGEEMWPETSSEQFETENINPENFLGEIYKDSELVIGLVGTVGSRLGHLTENLKEYLISRFGYDVEVISVSSKIIQKHNKITTHTSEFERIKSFMDAGNSIRNKFKDNSFIALDVARVISEIREQRLNECKTKRVAYIINSLKHDEEIKRLRQIYSEGFFQISLYESASRRSEYLVKDKGMTSEQANELIQRDEEEIEGHGQHTRDAFHLADYFVKFDGSYDSLRNSCFRFLSLIFGDPFITPTFDEFATFMAFSASLRSADLSRQVGAIIARDETILATGANDIPKFGGGLYWPKTDPNTGEVFDLNDGRDYKRNEDSNVKEKIKITSELTNALINLLDTSKIENNENSEKLAKLKEAIGKTVNDSKIKDITEYGRVVHAEMEALLSCGRERITTKNATLYATTFPCHNCAKHIIASGIKRVVFVEPYPKSKALDFHRESVALGFRSNDESKLIMEPFVGVGARNFLNLFSMSLGSGHELKRKNKFGNTQMWSPRNAQLRTALLPYSYKERENMAKVKVTSLLNEN